MPEIELKFGLTEAAATTVGTTLAARGAETLALESHYFLSLIHISEPTRPY